MREIPLVLYGFGNVGRSVVRLIADNDGYASEGVRLTLHSVFDSQGGARVAAHDPAAVLEAKLTSGSALATPGVSRIDPPEALAEAPTSVLVDCSITDAATGGPGLDVARLALESGHPVVFASKGPLVHSFSELSDLARRGDGRIAASAAVGIPLPSFEVALEGVRGAGLERIRGTLNDTANQILRALEKGESLAAAVARAQEAGTIEADPRLDLDGWDAAYKLLILARALWDPDLALSDLEIEGVGAIDEQQLAAAAATGRRVRLVATGERDESGTVRLRTRPESLSADDPLYALGPGEKGLVLETRLMGRIAVTASRGGPLATAACVIKDILNLELPPGL